MPGRRTNETEDIAAIYVRTPGALDLIGCGTAGRSPADGADSALGGEPEPNGSADPKCPVKLNRRLASLEIHDEPAPYASGRGDSLLREGKADAARLHAPAERCRIGQIAFPDSRERRQVDDLRMCASGNVLRRQPRWRCLNWRNPNMWSSRRLRLRNVGSLPRHRRCGRGLIALGQAHCGARVALIREQRREFRVASRMQWEFTIHS